MRARPAAILADGLDRVLGSHVDALNIHGRKSSVLTLSVYLLRCDARPSRRMPEGGAHILLGISFLIPCIESVPFEAGVGLLLCQLEVRPSSSAPCSRLGWVRWVAALVVLGKSIRLLRAVPR